MATRIRLARRGRKKRPFYRIVVADSRAPRDGSFIERLGSYDPLLAENKVSVDVERVKHWLDVGAKPSERVSRLLATQGVEHKLVVVPEPPKDKPAAKGKAKAKAEEAPADAPKAAAKDAKAEAAKADEPQEGAKEAQAEGAETEAAPEEAEDKPAGDEAEQAS